MSTSNTITLYFDPQCPYLIVNLCGSLAQDELSRLMEANGGEKQVVYCTVAAVSIQSAVLSVLLLENCERIQDVSAQASPIVRFPFTYVLVESLQRIN